MRNSRVCQSSCEKQKTPRPSPVLITMILVSTLLALVLNPTCAGQTENLLYTFDGTPGTPSGSLTQGRDGRLYGTTHIVSDSNGSIFAVATDGTFTDIHEFVDTYHDGYDPRGGLTLATNGKLYGVAYYGGGSCGQGTLFSIDLTKTFAVVQEFCGTLTGGPSYPPIEGSDGNLYGTSWAGGTQGKGLFYRYSRSGIDAPLFEFDSAHGKLPDGLLQGADGNYYAVAEQEGSHRCGTIVKFTSSGTLLHYYSFACGSRGAYPSGPLVQASDGNFYGVTYQGGDTSSPDGLGYGTIFKLTQDGRVSTVHALNGNSDGSYPVDGLVAATDGKLYGITQGRNGSIFRVGLDGTYSVVYNFASDIGSIPAARLVQHTNGKFYGATLYGGPLGYGTIYSLDMGLDAFITFVRPTGKVGQNLDILGQGLSGATSVTFNGVPATSFSVVSDTYMTAVVPANATTGPVAVVAPTGTFTSNVNFRVSH